MNVCKEYRLSAKYLINESRASIAYQMVDDSKQNGYCWDIAQKLDCDFKMKLFKNTLKIDLILNVWSPL